MLDSDTGRHWTLGRAQDAIKTAFFAKQFEVEGRGPFELRFSDFKASLSEGDSPIGDRMLSRAMDSLVKAGYLLKRREGRSSFYSLTIPRRERVKAVAKADGASIERAAALGGVGALGDGWVAYGVPDELRGRFRRLLKVELSRHRERLERILDVAFDDAVRHATAPASRRMSKRAYAKGVSSLVNLLAESGILMMGASYGTRLWSAIERAQRGSLGAAKPDYDLPEAFVALLTLFEGSSSEGRRALARRAGESEGAVMRRLTRMRREITALASDIKPLWGCLTEAERKRTSMQLAALVGLIANLTSVVHA